MIAGTARKLPCEICGFSFHRGNFDRHVRVCIRNADVKRRRRLAEQMKAAPAKDPWAPYRVGGQT